MGEMHDVVGGVIVRALTYPLRTVVFLKRLSLFNILLELIDR